MRFLPFFASALALVGMAIPAHADPDDDAFLTALNKAGISYQNPDRAIKAGQKVCDLANSGTSEADIIKDLHEFNPAVTMGKAALFVQAAASAYCPDRLASSDGGTNSQNKS
ncbi:MAG: DUF732 domain-containing protein [Actinomycetota bacterium]|nr:DUF732 domain-containing protein [Actinomycetota bacterium]